MRLCWTLPFLLLLEGALVCSAGMQAWAGDLTSERKAELRNLVLQDCGSCHGMTLKGGLGSPLRSGDLDGVETETIAQIVLNGVPGKPMPPWRGLLSEAEAGWIAATLKAGDYE